MREAPPNRVGEIYGDYRIVKRIGVGATGEVYEAVDIRLNRPAALKFLQTHLWEHFPSRERFKWEAQAASSLDHPNVCTIFGIGEAGPEGKDPYIAMAFCEGKTLAARISGGPLSIQEVVSIGKQIAAGLIAAHDKGIVHRDIKPGNVMLRKDGIVKIVDFGLAKLKEAPTLTRPGSIVGTPLYMSPEQCSGDKVDRRTDIWALGTVLYEMITGQAAFYDNVPEGIIYNIHNVEPPELRTLRADVPSPLAKIVEKALEKDRYSRYENMNLMLADLEKALLPETEQDSPSASTPTEPAPKPASDSAAVAVSDGTASRRRRGFPLTPVAGLAALVAIVGGLVWSGLWPSGDGVRQSEGLSTADDSPLAIPVSERSFAYWISVQRYRDGKPYREPFRLEREMVFESDYRIFIHLTVSEEGYLYVINEGPGSGQVAPSYNLLFPKTTLNGGEALLAAGQTLQLPELGGFRFDNEVGQEKVWFAWTSEPAPPLEAVKDLANPRDRGVIGDEVQALAVHEFLAQHSKTAANTESVEGQQMTRVTGQGAVLVYPIVLEHR